jgi:mersacidin/lichenicidin family type 2 lantibiotic
MNLDIVQAWKNDAYRASLSAEEQAMLPESPAGEYELSDADLEVVYGAHHSGSGGGTQVILNSLATAASCIQSDAAPCITLNGNCFNFGG